MLDASQRRNRLTGSANYPAWGLQENYDRYANRLSQVAISGCTGQTCPQPSVTIDVTTNRVTGSPYNYDANGNMTNDGLNTLVYDAENRTLTATNGSASATYSYDGKGLRVKKVSGSTTTVYIFGGSRVIAEYDNGAAPTAPSREYVYGGSALLAKIDSSGTKYYHQDQLSNRLVTSSTGATVTQLGHFPYGEAWYNTTNDKLFFTSYERDAESGNDYAIARYYISRLARFTSPDIQSGSTANPQSLNRYSYVLNNPGGLVDPSGQCGEEIETHRRRKWLYYGQGGRELDYEELAVLLGLQDPPPADDCLGNNGGEGGEGYGGGGAGGGGVFAQGPGGPTNALDLQVITLVVWVPQGCQMSDPMCQLQNQYLMGSPGGYNSGGNGGGGGNSSGFHFQLIPDSLRLPGEKFGACVDRVQSALLGNTGKGVLGGVTGASLVTSIFTSSPGTTLAAAGKIQGEVVNNLGAQISGDVIQTQLVPKPSIAATAINEGVAAGSVPADVGAAAVKGANFLGKFASVLTAIGVGIEGGFLVSCR